MQPRIRLTRSFDELWHSYLGYVLGVEGNRGNERGSFSVAVGKAAHERHRFRVGMVVRGRSVPVADPRKETASLYTHVRHPVAPRTAGKVHEQGLCGS